MNILQQRYKYIKKQQHMLTTKITSNSFDIVNHFVTTLHKILTSRIKTITKQSINILNKYNKIQPQMLLFLHHCATIIQSRFKGYQQRKYYQLFKPLLRRFKQLLIAVVAGWRIRRILKIKIINKKCIKIKECIGKQNYRQARILKRQLIDDLNQIVSKGKWLQFVDKKNGYVNRKQNVTKITKILLKTKQKKNGKNQIMQQKSSKISKNQTKRQEQSQKQQKQIQNNRLNINVIQQKPIKSTGFYKIPNQQLNQNPQPIQSKTIKNKKKFLKTTNVEPSSKTQPKENSKPQQKRQNTKNNDQKAVKNDKINQSLSILSIHLPTEQLQIKQNQIFPIPSKTIRLQIKKNMKNQSQNINRNNQIQPNILQATKIKKIPQKKGIKVTLSLSNSKVEQNNVNNKQIELEVKKQQKQAKQKNQHKHQNQHKDQLSQIISIYNSTYSSKKNQITSRLSQMRSHTKFTSTIK